MMRADIFSTIDNYLQTGKPVIQEGTASVYEDTGMHVLIIDLVTKLIIVYVMTFLFLCSDFGGRRRYSGHDQRVARLEGSTNGPRGRRRHHLLRIRGRCRQTEAQGGFNMFRVL